MAELKANILKASASAIAIAILLGAAVYVLSPRIETAPTVTTVDAYTDKGGFGPGLVSSAYLNDENVNIFANVRDATHHPVTGATVIFEIHGPLGSNVNLTQTTTTNSSGVAVATVTPSHLVVQQEAILGVWSATASTEVTGTRIVDSLAFEVKAQPSPSVDVYADRGGNGSNTQSLPYSRLETVNLYAEVNNGTSPVKNVPVAFYIYSPANSTVKLVRTPQTNSSGITEAVAFTIPDIADSIGMWQVIVNVRINDDIFVDTLAFDCVS